MPTVNITITDTTIEPSQEARYLGVIFDRKLRFTQYIQHAVKKGTKFTLAISRITKSTWGTTYQQSRMLFNSVVAPRMDYAAIVWHRPKEEGQITQSPQLSKITTAQRTAMKAILGAFRTTSTSALEIETALQPPHLRIRRKVLQTFTRMQTAPQMHPIAFAIHRAQTSKSKVHITTLEYISRTFPQYAAQQIETIKPFALPPWWEPVHTINIPENKKVAKKRYEETVNDPNTLCIFTDGSGINGHIGAAVYTPQTSEAKHLYLGNDKQFNVYTAELSAINLAIDIAIDITDAPTAMFMKCKIHVDSQATIKATVKPGNNQAKASYARRSTRWRNLPSKKALPPKSSGSLDTWISSTMIKLTKKLSKQRYPEDGIMQSSRHPSPPSNQREYNLSNNQPMQTGTQHGSKIGP
jgi:hypothetical protein